MSSKLKPRRVETVRPATRQRIELRLSGAAGIHQDQNRRRGGKAARGGRQGERNALRKEW